MKKSFILIILTVLLSGCSLLTPGCRETEGSINLMTWNVENLFDDIYNGTEYRDFIPGETGWTSEDFHGKMNSLSDAIRRLIPGGPDVLLLQEIENVNVLEIFNTDYLKGMDYRYCFLARKEGQAAGTSILSRYPASKVFTHQTSSPLNRGGRPIMEIWLDLPDGTIIIFNNHWKSKSGGEEETEPARRDSASFLNRRLDELFNEVPDIPVLIAGDLNEDIDEFRRNEGMYHTALADSDDFSLFPPEEQDRTLFFSRDSMHLRKNSTLLYSAWSRDKDRGSYYFRGEWEKIDHFLLSSHFLDGKEIDVADFTVCSDEFLLYPDGSPKRWNRERGEGYSDHLPLLLKLTCH